MEIRLLAKMTVLVPVPEGSINAKEQAKVAGIIANKGFMLAEMAMTPIIGRNIVAVAVLEFTSVMNIMIPVIKRINAKFGNPLATINKFPSHSASPEAQIKEWPPLKPLCYRAQNQTN